MLDGSTAHNGYEAEDWESHTIGIRKGKCYSDFLCYTVNKCEIFTDEISDDENRYHVACFL